MKMTPAFTIVGILLVFWASTYVAVILPTWTMEETPNENYQPWNEIQEKGNQLYVANGCSYCHSQFIRIQDWDIGAERIAQRGDYVGQQPIILGTERTGPDLSQAGGEHNDDWHRAHFANPRTTRPLSLMPSWEFLGQGDIEILTAFIQSRSGLVATQRMERQNHWQPQVFAAYQAGPDANIRWLHSHVPEVWQRMPNPYPATPAAMARGKVTYERYCINCHGSVGDGQGTATPYFKNSAPPLNFTTLTRNLVEGRYIGGILYYQIMNGITGSAMPYFKKELESEKIWDVSNYLAVTFVGYTDADIPPEGINASFEPLWVNPFVPKAVGNPVLLSPSIATQPSTQKAEGQP